MSQSILITGTFRNNKKTSCGCHNPKNDRPFSINERKHLNTVFEEFKKRSDKFKNVSITMTDFNGKLEDWRERKFPHTSMKVTEEMLVKNELFDWFK